MINGIGKGIKGSQCFMHRRKQFGCYSESRYMAFLIQLIFARAMTLNLLNKSYYYARESSSWFTSDLNSKLQNLIGNMLLQDVKIYGVTAGSVAQKLYCNIVSCMYNISIDKLVQYKETPLLGIEIIVKLLFQLKKVI